MNNEYLEWARCSMEEIRKITEELKWDKYLGSLPNRFLEDKRDGRSVALLHLSWLLSDLCDCNWDGYTPSDMVTIIRSVADGIANTTEPG